MLALGGFAGFMACFFGTMLGSGDPFIALRNGSIGCLLGFFMCKGAMLVVLNNMQSVLERKYRERVREARALAEKAAAEEAAASEKAAAEALGQVNERLRRTREHANAAAAEAAQKASEKETATAGAPAPESAAASPSEPVGAEA